MRISATVTHQPTPPPAQHRAVLGTGEYRHELVVAAKATGGGSATNGGELLMLALATCYCNDLFREAARLGLSIDAVEVEAFADFEGIGLPARNVRYRAAVTSPASAEDIARLLDETDAVAEVHNTLRKGVDVRRI